MIWNALIAVGQQLLIQQAKRLLIPNSLNMMMNITKSTMSLTKEKAIINKGISGISNLVPVPLRSALNYTLKSNYNGLSIDNERVVNLIKADIKKSLYNQFVPNNIKFILSIYNKANAYIEKTIRKMEQEQRAQIRERVKELKRLRRETLRQLKEQQKALLKYYQDEKKALQMIDKWKKELYKKVYKQIKEDIRIQKKVNKQIHEDIQRRFREQEKNVRLFEKHLANIAYEENNNLHYKDFFDFLDTLDENERKRVQELIHNYTNVRINFNSTWIKAATWEPLVNIRDYKDQVGQMTNHSKSGTNKVFSNSASGILKILIKKKFKSKTNPKRLYAWYNVSFGQWKRIIAIKNGKNFWNVFYRQNRQSRRYITNESKYYKYDRSIQYKANRRYKRSPRQEDYTSY